MPIPFKQKEDMSYMSDLFKLTHTSYTTKYKIYKLYKLPVHIHYYHKTISIIHNI